MYIQCDRVGPGRAGPEDTSASVRIGYTVMTVRILMADTTNDDDTTGINVSIMLQRLTPTALYKDNPRCDENVRDQTIVSKIKI